MMDFILEQLKNFSLKDVLASASDEYYVYLCFNPDGDYEEFRKLVLEVSNGKDLYQNS